MSRLAAAVLAAAALAGCSSATMSPAPSAPVEPGAPVAPSEGAVDPSLADPFFPGDPIAVAVRTVHVYLEADEASQLIGDAEHGDVLQIIDFPKTDAVGRLWVYVVALNSPVNGRLPDLPTILPDSGWALKGWIVALDATNASVTRLPPRCPVVADFAHVAAMLGNERLACFGNRQLTLEGVAGCGPCGGDTGVYEPPWLAGSAGGSIVANSGQGSIALWLPPPLVAPAGGTLIRVVGHFDDPRAATCRVELDGVQLPAVETVEPCRRHFVVDILEILPKPPPDPLE